MLCLGKNTLGERGADFMFALARSTGGGVPSWVFRDENGDPALFEHDIANSRYWFNEQTYASEAALLTATGGVLASGAYTFNNVVGVDTVQNGGFDTDTDWTKGAGITISGGVANIGAGAGYLEQGQVTVAGQANRVRATAIGNPVYCGAWDTAGQSVALSSSPGGRSVGAVEFFFKANDALSFLGFTATGSGALTLDNVSNVAVEGIPGIVDAVSAVIYASTSATHVADQCLWSSDLSNTSNYIRLIRNTSEEIRLIVRSSNTEVANLLLGTVADSTDFGVAFAVAANDVWGKLEGGTAQTDVTAAFPGIAYHRLGRSSAGDAWGGSLYGQAQWNRRVSSSRLAEILDDLAATF